MSNNTKPVFMNLFSESRLRERYGYPAIGTTRQWWVCGKYIDATKWYYPDLSQSSLRSDSLSSLGLQV